MVWLKTSAEKVRAEKSIQSLKSAWLASSGGLQDTIEALFVDLARKGGAGSGNYGHSGRPGMRGGSGPGGSVGGSGQAPAQAQYNAGITSARPGKTRAQVESEMSDFQSALEATPATGVSVQMGTGGWEGGEEPTWITEFKDGPEAVAAVAAFAEKHDQDAALLMKYVPEGTAGASPQKRFSFQRGLEEPELREIEKAMVVEGVGGWTWGKGPKGQTLMIQHVPDWVGQNACTI